VVVEVPVVDAVMVLPELEESLVLVWVSVSV
jgi:hypothetical protein